MSRLASSFEPLHQRRRDAHLVHDPFMQDTVYPLPDPQHALLGLDMDIRGLVLDRLVEQLLQQPHHRGIFGGDRGEHLLQIDIALREFLVQLAGQLVESPR